MSSYKNDDQTKSNLKLSSLIMAATEKHRRMTYSTMLMRGVVLFLFILSSSSLSYSESVNASFVMNGATLLEQCKVAVATAADIEDASGYKAAACLLFIDGVEEGYRSAIEIENKSKTSFCIPRKLGMTERALTVVRYLQVIQKNGAELGFLPGSMLVLEAYKKYYPCVRK